MENLGLFAVWFLIGAWFIAAVIFFIVADIKEYKARKKREQKKDPPPKNTEEIAKENGIETRDVE